MNDQLDNPPGTVAVRAALAAEAVQLLGRVAALERADPALRRQAAEGYRRLAVLQNAVDRPSLRDRAAARRSLEAALALLSGDAGPDAAQARARIQLEAARQAGGGGGLEEADRLLASAEPVALADPAGPLAEDWWLARAEVASWAGDHETAVAAARRVSRSAAGSPLAMLRQLRARDLEAEGLYYLGRLEAARAAYAEALAEAEQAVARWPADSRLNWNLLRQRWNLGSTLIMAAEPDAAVPLLAEALSGWEALARADRSDEALGAWVRATRLSYGQALDAAGGGCCSRARRRSAMCWHGCSGRPRPAPFMPKRASWGH
jgi:tetratricopeptide (TPR) repeat protein